MFFSVMAYDSYAGILSYREEVKKGAIVGEEKF